jgi:single-stranded-DNA-specific exonuclease
MGSAETAAALFFEKNSLQRENLAKKLTAMNDERRSLEDETWLIIESMAYKTFTMYDEKLIFVYSEKINKGVTGLMAQRAVRIFNVPSIAISIGDEICTASLRSARGYNICAFLEQFDGLFIDSGGHQAAGGFSMLMSNWESFLERLNNVICTIEFDDEAGEQIINIDAELPHSFLSLDILKLIERFEPYGKDNEQLVFLAKNLTIQDINFIGKESQHAKLTIDVGKYKWPALYWQSAERFTNKEFSLNDKVDIVFNISRDYFKGIETAQMMILDLRKSTPV